MKWCRLRRTAFSALRWRCQEGSFLITESDVEVRFMLDVTVYKFEYFSVVHLVRQPSALCNRGLCLSIRSVHPSMNATSQALTSRGSFRGFQRMRRLMTPHTLVPLERDCELERCLNRGGVRHSIKNHSSVKTCKVSETRSPHNSDTTSCACLSVVLLFLTGESGITLHRSQRRWLVRPNC